MTTFEVKITTKPKDLFFRLRNYKTYLDKELDQAMTDSIAHAHKKTPKYPPVPANSSYIRTGFLGQSFGISMGGQPLGLPDVYEWKRVGSTAWRGELGSMLGYAERTVGLNQEAPWASYWWNVGKWAKISKGGIKNIYVKSLKKMAKWITGGQ